MIIDRTRYQPGVMFKVHEFKSSRPSALSIIILLYIPLRPQGSFEQAGRSPELHQYGEPRWVFNALQTLTRQSLSSTSRAR